MEANGKTTKNRGEKDKADRDEMTTEIFVLEEPLPADQPSRRNRVLCQYAATIIVNLTSLVYGVSVAWASTALPVLQSEDTPLSTGPITEKDTSWLSSSLCLMAFISTPVFSVLSTKISRKAIGYIIAALPLISWFVLSVTALHSMLYLARILVGIAAGGTILFVPLYVSEIAEDSIRGALGCMFVFFINIGILFGYIIGSYVPYFTQTKIYFIIPVLFLICFIFLPETPFFLLNNDKSVQATRALQRLRGGKRSDVTQEMAILKESLENSSADTSKCSFRKMFSSRGTIRGLIISIVLCANQQLSGIFAILSFTVQIFLESGSNLPASIATIIVGILQLFGTFLSCLLVERFGRRILLLISNITIVLDLGILGSYFYFKHIGSDVSSVSWIPLMCLSVYMVIFSIGLGPLPFVIMTELLPVQIRSIASSIVLCSLWGLAFLVVIVFNPIADVLGVHGCYWIFTFFTFLGTIFVAFCVPETKGQSLEAIIQDLNQGSWRIRNTKSFTINSIN